MNFLSRSQFLAASEASCFSNKRRTLSGASCACCPLWCLSPAHVALSGASLLRMLPSLVPLSCACYPLWCLSPAHAALAFASQQPSWIGAANSNLQHNSIQWLTFHLFLTQFWLKYDLGQQYYAHQVDLTGVWTRDIQVMTIHFMSLRHLL